MAIASWSTTSAISLGAATPISISGVGTQQHPRRGCPGLSSADDTRKRASAAGRVCRGGQRTARAPRFYNTLTANCTNLVFDMVRAIHPGVPIDARVLLAGYLPNYAYDLGATVTSMSFEIFASSLKSTTRRRGPMPIPTSQRESEMGSRCIVDAAEALAPRLPGCPRPGISVKTDRRQVRGVAPLMRLDRFGSVRCKPPRAQEVRVPLTARNFRERKS